MIFGGMLYELWLTLHGAAFEARMAELLTPEIVLARFDSMRSKVVSAIKEGEKLAEKVPALNEAAKRFENAANLVSEARLSLVVLGAEGSGKSTLIRGILGIELAPIEADEPGTVAPIYIAYGPSAEPIFEVRFLSKKEPKICNKDSYYDYMRQSKNPDNREGVECAFVRVKHSLLAHGLVLVDMPGTGGCSDVVRMQAQEFIHDETAAVIGVVSKRDYRPLIDIAQMFVGIDGKLKFQAIVSNRWSDTFVAEGSLEPLPEEEVARIIENGRLKAYEVIETRIREFGLQGTFAQDIVFVFSANALYKRSGPIMTAPHHREMSRFFHSISRYLQENGLGMAIQSAAREGEDVLGVISSHVNLRRDILRRILAGDKDLLRLYREHKLASWNSLWTNKGYSQVRRQQLKDMAWDECLARVKEHQRETIRKIDALISELRRLPKGTTSGAIRDKVARARSENADQVEMLNAELAEVLMKARDALTADANQVLSRILERLPVLESHGGVSMTLTPEDIMRTAIREINDGSGRQLFKFTGGALGAAGGLGLGTKAAAMMFLAPDPTFITQTIGLLLGGAVAFGAVDIAAARLLGNEIEAAVKELTKMKNQISDEKLRDKQFHALKTHVMDTIDRVCLSVNEALTQRLKEIDTLIQYPATSSNSINAELGSLDALGRSVDSLEKRLLAIRGEAWNLSQATVES